MISLANPRNNMKHDYHLDTIIEVLNRGGTILYPTDTIWGLGCDATNADAVQKIYALKKRDFAKPFVLLMGSVEMLKTYVAEVHPRIETLLAYHTQPLTIIYENARHLPPGAVSSEGTVAARIPNDPFCRALLNQFGKPLVATSANISDEPFPRHFGEISSEVIQSVDHVIKYRQADKTMGQPSVIAKISDPVRAELVFLRE